MKVVAIIPARYTSKRFPGKVLVPIKGKPMIQWVWERASMSKRISDVYVATDDEKVAETVKSFGGHAIMTSKDHRSGTERVSEASGKIEADIIINLQGDEPFIDPEGLDRVAEPLIMDESLPMSSLKFPITNYSDYMDPNVVKVITDEQENAIYFSRSPIPYFRDCEDELKIWKNGGARPDIIRPVPMKHIGIYGFRKEFLQALSRIPVASLEKAESLEQLRAMSWGFKIKVVTAKKDCVGVDVPEDIKKVEELMEREGQG